MLTKRFSSAAMAVPSWKGEYRARLYAALGLFLLLVAGVAIANQTPSTSAGAGPVIKTFPGGTTLTISETGANTAFFATSVPLNNTGGVTAAMLSPSIAATTNAVDFDVTATGCTIAVGRCANRGNITLTFSSAVTNPVIHISGIGSNNGTPIYHTAFVMSSSDAPTLPTFTRLAGNTQFTVSSTEIRSTAINGGTDCTVATAASCGSVRINGTFTTVTMQLDLLMAGTGTPTGTDGWTLTASVDEDFGDAPGSYDTTAAASHIVGGYYMGTAPTVENAGVTNVQGTPITPSPIANATASTDGSDNGVTFPTLTRSVASTINVAVTGSGGRLQGWIDWADDGNFTTAGDRIATDATDGGVLDTDGLVNGVIRLAVTPPAGTTQVTTISRFRWSPTAGVGPTTRGTVGEVEDYEVIVYPQRADLSLTKTVSNATPSNGASNSYVLRVTSAASTASTVTATGITVQDTLPAGFSFTSASGTGTYNSGTGVWSVGSLAPGAFAEITINGTVTATAGTVTNTAQITASSVPDPDSTVNNGVTTEDDYASVPFSVPSTLPAPVCPIGTTNQIITNGTFSTGTGPNWPSWTGTTPWVGTTAPSVSDNAVSGTLSQSGLSGLNFGPSATNGSVVQLSAWWRNGAPASGSTTSTLTVSVAGTAYARITTDSSAGTSAAVTYLNGATGNLSTITEFTYTGWRINIPTSVSATGAISFAFVPGGGTAADDFEIDNVTLYTCTPQADLSLTKTVSNPLPAFGGVVSYTLRVTSDAAASSATATGITVQDTLPAGFTYVNATGTGTYDSATGIWTVGSLAPGAFAEITLNGTVAATAGTTVTNVAQVRASSLVDPDSTPNNGVTTEDDYASVAFTTATPTVINCPTGSTATGSGYSATGTGAYLNQIYWLDWSCGGTTSFPAASIINKSWNVGDGLVVTAQITNLTEAIRPYVTGSYGGDALPGLYSGLNPIGLIGVTDGQDPQFQITYTTTLNGQPVSTSYVMSDAESLDGAAESISATTTTSNWTLLESSGVVNTNLAGNSFTMSDAAAAGNGTAIVETTGLNPQLNVTINQGGLQAAAFGIYTPFDYSDAPLTGTSYGSTNHRTLPGLRMGAGVTRESAAYDSPTASADADDAVTFPNLFRNQAASINVPVSGPGYLSAWADWNDDGDFADAGEKYASDAVDGGAGDADATVNGTIVLAVTPPATAATTATIGRFRYASTTGAPISGLYGFGEVEDYPLTVVLPRLDVTKTSYIVTDYISASNPKSIPGALVRYCILVTNSGSAPATGVDINDTLPGDVTYVPGSMLSASGCSATATAEDDNAADGDENDPFGMSISGTTVTGTAATLGVGDSFALIFNAVVD